MAQYFTMPGLSADAEEALLEEWLIKEGDELSEGQPIATVETDKAVVDIDINDDGVVHALLVEIGTSVPVGDPILVLRAPDEDPAEADQLRDMALGAAPASPAPAEAPAPTEAPAAPETDSGPAEAPAPEQVAAPASPATEVAAPAAPAKPNGGRIFVTPIVRRLARENGVDLSTITGTGKNGRIVRRDFEKALAELKAAPQAPATPQPAVTPATPEAPAPGLDLSAYPDAEFVEHTKIRKIVARRLQQSKREAPHFYLRRSVLVDDLLALRKELNEKSGVRISVNDLVVKAAAKALAEFPDVNSIWDDAGAYRLATVDVSVAVASERGLVTPVVRNADQLALSALSSSIKDLASRANENRLKQDELVGGSLTVSNLGMFGVEDFDAIINPPQSAILAVGAAVAEPVVKDGEITVGTVMNVSLSVDHRSVDGALGAQFLARIVELLESPFGLLI